MVEDYTKRIDILESMMVKEWKYLSDTLHNMTNDLTKKEYKKKPDKRSWINGIISSKKTISVRIWQNSKITMTEN